jgi:hypothetical protein
MHQESHACPNYLLDTNVLIDFGRDPILRGRLEGAQRNGCVFVLGPPALIELVRGLVAGGRDHFHNNKNVFVWLRNSACAVLPLPRPFMAAILRAPSLRRVVEVEPRHYIELIGLIARAADFNDFLQQSDAPDSAWGGIRDADAVHNVVLDREFAGLKKLAGQRVDRELARRLSRSFGAPGRHPNSLIVERRFSAAFEFLGTSLAKVRGGARPRENDPGLFVDFQLLLYLADPNVVFLTREDFSHEIRRSPQRSRIVHPRLL